MSEYEVVSKGSLKLKGVGDIDIKKKKKKKQERKILQQVTKLSAAEDDVPAAVKKGMIKTKAELAFESMQQKRMRLRSLLPQFLEDGDEERERSLTMVLRGENIAFGNPIQEVIESIRCGDNQAEIHHARRLLRQAKYREYFLKIQKYYQKLLEEVLVMRKDLLRAAMAGEMTSAKPLRLRKKKKKKQRPNFVSQRANKRYLRELSHLQQEFGDDSSSSSE
ncbi:unnamed protein product [Darwinula stevensoni]|uniref:Uncharacterized protein n=1 Tax=Darwinula stevensoni TaxID=69355 RepID=A0A7R9ADS1_9CRUS|nr:unnamed protein product [Darwinula stevensoni]CAG0901578.1 unnamed protein product [Darwinula stevensoni]